MSPSPLYQGLAMLESELGDEPETQLQPDFDSPFFDWGAFGPEPEFVTH